MYLGTYQAVLLWTFAIYGFLCFLFQLFNSFSLRKKYRRGDCYIILAAKNQQDMIESMLRHLIFRAGLEGRDELLTNIMLIDANSSDDTQRIMKRLAREYRFVKVIKPTEIQSFVEELAR